MAKFYYSISENSFINPYTFVELPVNEVERPAIGIPEGELSGVLKCKITALTPLTVPDGECRMDEEPIRRYPFMSINGVPFISGSTVRGAVRMMYETLTDSCFSTMEVNEVITKRSTSSDDFKPAVLIKKDNEWELYSAKKMDIDRSSYDIDCDEMGRFIYHGGHKFVSGQSVSIVDMVGGVVKEMEPAEPGTSTYYLRVGEPTFKTNKAYIFSRRERLNVDKKKLKKAIIGLDNTVSIYQDKAINGLLGVNGNSGYLNYAQAKKNGVICVYAKFDNHTLYLSMAAVGRRAYEHTIGELIENDKLPCSDRTRMCPACRVWGMIKGEGFSSRVRISDAKADMDTFSSMGTVVIKPIGPPRATYLPFYSTDGKEYDEKGARIRGRKFYWNNSAAATDPSVYTHTEDFDIGTWPVELAAPGSEFYFDLYYENLSENELNLLKFVICLPDIYEEKRELAHRMGHGKPLGLGAVKIDICKDIRRIEKRNRLDKEPQSYIYETEEIDVDKEAFVSLPEEIVDSIYNQIRIVCDLHALDGENIAYPYVELDEGLESVDENVYAAHRWYGANEGKGRRPYSEEITLLPPISENIENQKMKTYIAIKSVAGQEKKECANIERGFPTYHAVCLGRANNPRFSKAKLDNGDIQGFYDEEGVPEGTEITLEYRGKSKKTNKEIWMKV